MHSKKKQEPSMFHHVLTVTSPTRELTCPQFIEDLIQPHSNYQVIPSPLILNYDADQIVLTALPASKNKLVDISLPLILTDLSGNQINYFGRYLLYNCRLIGIKLSSSNKQQPYLNGEFKRWRSGTTMKYRIPNVIYKYYRQCRFEEGTFRDQIVIGDFILNIGSMKICLLFESEMEGQSTLFQYKKQGCQIFSIVCDIPKEQSINFNLPSTKNENILKRFGKQNNRLILYTGVRMATPTNLFLSNSFIFHPYLSEKSQNYIEPFFFNDAMSLSLSCNINITKEVDLNESRMQKGTKIKALLIEETPFIPYLSGIKQGETIKTYPAGSREIKTYTKQNGDLLKKMKLWYFYNSDNGRRPFIFPLPLSQPMLQIVKQLQKLAAYLALPIQDFMLLYNKDKSQIEVQQSMGSHTYRDLSQLCQKRRNQILNIYTDDRRNYEQLLLLAKTNIRLRVYYNYINLKIEKEVVRPVKEKMSKLDDFAHYIIRNKIVGYHQLLFEARSQLWKLNKAQQIQAITINLVRMLRAQVQNHAFYKNLLQKNEFEIEQALGQAQIQMVNNQGFNVALQNKIQSTSRLDEEISIHSSQKEKQKQFLVKMKQMRRSQALQLKNIELICHGCKMVYNKQYFYKCNVCGNKICFLCSSEFMNKYDFKSRKQLMDSLRCIVCKKICNCFQCQNKLMKPEQSLDMSTTLKFMQISQLSSAVQQEQNKKSVEQYKQYKQCCTVCLINERRGGQIKVLCCSCERQECLMCIRSQKVSINFEQWQCSVCKPPKQPAPQLIVEDKQDSKSNQAIQAQPPSPSLSRSRSKSPPKNLSSFKSNENHRPFQRNSQPYQNRNNNFSRNNNGNERGRSRMIDQNEQKKSNRSVSCSQSIPRNRNKAPQRKESVSRSNSPKKTNKNERISPQKNAPRVNKWNNKPQRSRSISASQSPVNRKAKVINNANRDLSNSASPPKEKNQRRRSNSGSGSRTPPRLNKKKRSSSHSKKSKSRSNSRSRSKSLSRNRANSSNDFKIRQQTPQKLWNKEKKWGNNNYNNSNNNYNNNQRFDNNRGGRGGRGGGYRGRGGFDRNQGGYDRNQGGYNRNQGNYSRNQGNYDNNRYNNNNNSRGGYNNGYNNNNRDKPRNEQQSNQQQNQILSVNNYESNNDMEY